MLLWRVECPLQAAPSTTSLEGIHMIAILHSWQKQIYLVLNNTVITASVGILWIAQNLVLLAQKLEMKEEIILGLRVYLLERKGPVHMVTVLTLIVVKPYLKMPRSINLPMH
uniref:Uncharacterized protein n=1 Tax=Arundo donax TaxID=35708 RepID=A0A0A9H9Q2_ARUDO